MHRSGRTLFVLLTALVSVAPEARAWDASRARPRPARVNKVLATPKAPLMAPRPAARPQTSKATAKEPKPTLPPPKRTAPDKPVASKEPPKAAPEKPTASKEPPKAVPEKPMASKDAPKAASEKPIASKDSTKTTPEKQPSSKDSSKAASKPAAPAARSYFRVAKAPPGGASWAPYYRAPWKRGYVTLFGHGKKWSGYLMGPKGEVPPASRASLSSMLASWRTGKETLIDERLIAMIALASDEFGGRAVRIVSGYREHSYAPDSKHKLGQALDFSIPGVPNDALRDYLRTLGDVGIGFYPNSTHVHLDVREKTTYWVDYSFPGERPHYAYEPGTRKWGARERAIADALDHLPSSITAIADTTPRSVGKPAPPFFARPVPNRAVLAPTAPDSGTTVQRGPTAEGFTRSATPIVTDGGAATPHTTGDSGPGFWSRAAASGPDGGAITPDAIRSMVR